MAETMSREKQIEEMAKCLSELSCKNKCKNCHHFYNKYEVSCVDMNFAEQLYAKGYRKTADVAEEIFAEIENKLQANMSGEFRGDSVEWFDYFDLHLAEEIGELKKKYTEGWE